MPEAFSSNSQFVADLTTITINNLNALIKGTAANYAALPSGASEGDLYILEDTGVGYVSDGVEGWTSIGSLRAATWRSGATDPVSTTGSYGDWYLNTTSQDIFEKTNDSTWTLRVNISGTSTVGFDDFVALTQAAYDALDPPDPDTVYFIIG